MKLKLTKQFTDKERDFINNYLAQITLGNQVRIDSITLSKFFKRLSYRQNEQDTTLSLKEKNTLTVKLIEWIMQNEEAFIALIMAESSMLLSLSLLPPLKQNVNLLNKVMEKAASILKTNVTAREALIKNVADIDILTRTPHEGKGFLKALYDTNELHRLLKDNEHLCQEIERFPQLTRFFILSALKNESLFDALFAEGSARLRNVLARKNIQLTKDIEKAIDDKITTKQNKKATEDTISSSLSFFAGSKSASTGNSSDNPQFQKFHSEKPISISGEILEMFQGAFDLLDLNQLGLKERDKKIIQSFLINKSYSPEQIVFFARELVLPDALINSINVLYCALHPEKWEINSVKEHKRNLMDNTARFLLPVEATETMVNQCISQLKDKAYQTVSKFIDANPILTSEEENIKNHILSKNVSRNQVEVSTKKALVPEEIKKPSKGIIDDYLETYSNELEAYFSGSDSEPNSPRHEYDIERKNVENKLLKVQNLPTESQKEKNLWEKLDYFSQEWKDIYTLIKLPKAYYRLRDEAMMFQVVKAILYHEQTHCSWKSLPQDFIAGGQAFYYKRLWEKEGHLENILKIVNSSEQKITSMSYC